MPPDGRRFLVIYGQSSVQPSTVEVAAGLDRALSDMPPGRLEIYTAFLDNDRFPDEAHGARVADDLAARFGELPLDAVLAVGPPAVDFALARREAFAPDAPLVFGAMTEETVAALDIPADVHGVVSAFDVERTLRFALRLQPDARRIVLMSGSGPFDRRWTERAREALGETYDGVPVDYLTELTLPGFVDAARALDGSTILIILTIYRDAAGDRFLPGDSFRAIADASAAPIYTVYSSGIGIGALGGHVDTFTAVGEAMGRLALAVAGNAGAPPRFVDLPGEEMVDWREVVRFGIDPERVPDAAVRLFYTPTAWEAYRLEIVAAAAIILLQTATIVALLYEARRRRRLSREIVAGRLELAHASRAAQLGELSGALAHELNQPLGSILANAETGSRLLAADRPDLGEIAEILSDIAADDRRAAGIITELRRLLVKGEAKLEALDLNALVERTLALVRGELRARRTDVEFRARAAVVTVRANGPQIQQVVLNLVLNAAEAMSDVAPDRRRILITTAVRADGRRELRVADQGPGITPEAAAAAFRPFVTTKPNGLGLGLSICRSIAEAHRGTLAFDHGSETGAVVVLTLPAPDTGGADA